MYHIADIESITTEQQFFLFFSQKINIADGHHFEYREIVVSYEILTNFYAIWFDSNFKDRPVIKN